MSRHVSKRMGQNDIDQIILINSIQNIQIYERQLKIIHKSYKQIENIQIYERHLKIIHKSYRL